MKDRKCANRSCPEKTEYPDDDLCARCRDRVDHYLDPCDIYDAKEPYPGSEYLKNFIDE